MASKDVLKYGPEYIPTINDNTSTQFGTYETYSRDKIDSLVKNTGAAEYDWSGKKIVFEGESITTTGTPAYPEYVKEQTGCIPVNIGQAGHPILWSYPGEAWDYRQRLSNIPADADAIIIMGDYLGAPGEYTAPVSEESLDSWGGRWNLAVHTIKRAYPTVPLFLVSEFPVCDREVQNMNTAYQFQMTARKYGAIFVCLADESPLSLLYSQKTWGLDGTDGIHSNREAMPLFADVIIRHLKQVPPPVWTGTDSITIDATASTTVGGLASIDYTVDGDLSIQWTSDNPDVACVMSGLIFGMAAGTANITAKTRSGKTATCTVTVTA